MYTRILMLSIMGIASALNSNTAYSAGKVAGAPSLQFEKSEIQELLGTAYDKALLNLLSINTIPVDANLAMKDGLFDKEERIIRAGGDYPQPWIRDAAVNAWNAGSLLEPSVARNTLYVVLERDKDGRLTVQRDNQWWDKVIWITGAWQHYCITGDRQFLKNAYEAAQVTLKEMKEQHWDSEFKLYRGGAMLQDGIAGYPAPPANKKDEAEQSSFVLDYPAAFYLMPLSTNCLYYNGYKCAAEMAKEVGEYAEAERFAKEAQELKAAITKNLWVEDKGAFAYLLHGTGAERGQKAMYQEATGISFAILTGVADEQETKKIVEHVRISLHGIVVVDGHFERFSDERPGRHNCVIWPMAQGFWACAAAKAGKVDLFEQEVINLAELSKASGWNYLEIYNPLTGKEDGGWQCGRHWKSCRDQTWSATAYLRMIYYGVFGMEFEKNSITFNPTLGIGWKGAHLSGLKYRDMVLDIDVNGQGQHITKVTMDGIEQKNAKVPSHLKGRHKLKIMVD